MKTLPGFMLMYCCAMLLGGSLQGSAAANDSDAAIRRTQAQESARKMRLEDLERLAIEHNPTLKQAAAEVRAAEGRKLQAGLYPNPTIGATGDENSPGTIIRGGEFGFFIEQDVVIAGKLKLNRGIADRERAQAEIKTEAQRLRVLNSVRQLYYQAVGDERTVDLQSDLSRIADEAVTVTKQLYNVGQADQPDVLQAEIEAGRAAVELAHAQNRRDRTWSEIASVVGDPGLRPAPLEGDLEKIPAPLEAESALATILQDSPEVRHAQEGIARAEIALRRAKVEKIPDIRVRGGLRYNRELLERGGAPVGLEGFFDVGVRIPLFDRNQGRVAAARAEQDRAELEAVRVKLALRMRMASALREHRDARHLVEKYRDEILPRAEKALELFSRSFQQMTAAYPQVLVARRSLQRLRTDYVHGLVRLWKSRVEIQGFLLTDGLQPPMSAQEGMSEMEESR